MTTHNVHPSIRENGLADDCPRCREHSEFPFEGLDDGNLESLIDRIKDRRPSRSTNEALVMVDLRDAIAKANKLYQRGWRPS